MFDSEMIKAVYSRFPLRIAEAKKLIQKPLTLTEKILYTHLWEGNPTGSFERGKDYVDFAPDRVAMQDATAQMALLQFMQAGRPKVAVPSTVHCDHLILAKDGAKEDLATSKEVNKEVFDFLSSVSNIFCHCPYLSVRSHQQILQILAMDNRRGFRDSQMKDLFALQVVKRAGKSSIVTMDKIKINFIE